MKKCAVIIEPYSAGVYYADEFRKIGIESVAVLVGEVPDFAKKSYRPNDFKAIVSYNGNFNDLTSQLSKYNPGYVLMGTESGIGIMDRIAFHFGLPGNDPKTSLIRRDKFETQEALKRAGLRSIKQHRVSNISEARQWLQENDVWPVIVKPSDSAGSDNVHLCNTAEEVCNQLAAIFSSMNLFGRKNKYALIQEYLVGQEYVVDTVSCNGGHATTNISRYVKVKNEDARILYRHIEFLSPGVAEFRELIDYAYQVNTALGLNYGPAHLEIFMTEKGYFLVEMNPRMHGGDVCKTLQKCSPITQLDLSIDSVFNTVSFFEKIKKTITYNKHAVAHFLISKKSGVVESVASQETLKQFPSLVDTRRMPQVGEYIPKTSTLVDVPGVFWLMHENIDILRQDQLKLIEMEDSGELYKITS